MDLAKPGTNSSLALERLRGLLAAEFDSGADLRLPSERELAATIGVGRRAVRRALEVLEADGTIWRQQGKGTFAGARPAPRADLTALAAALTSSEIMEARLAVEPSLARLAALRAGPADVEALQHLAMRTASAEDDDGWELWDSALHKRIAEIASNAVLAATFEALQGARKEPEWRQVRASARTQNRRSRVFAEHDEIVAAIARGDGEAAERAMLGHLRTIEANLRAAAGTFPSEPAARSAAANDAGGLDTTAAQRCGGPQ